jgi:hypothetical protein
MWVCKDRPQSGNTKYSCSGTKCVEDPNGKYDVSNCNDECAGPANCDPGEDGNLPYPQAWGGVIHSDKLKPVDNFKSYKKILVSGANGCELSECNDPYKVSDDKSFCVNKNIGQSPCDTSKNAQVPNESYRPYKDPNANWSITYVYPDGDTEYCTFASCIDGYSLDQQNNTCKKDKVPCGDPPQFSDPKQTTCRDDGTYVVTGCITQDGVVYKPNNDKTGCVKSSCVDPCGRIENNCVLDPTNTADIKCAVYGNQNMGSQESAILQYARSNGNVYKSGNNLFAKIGDMKNPWGGCGNTDLPEFVADPTTNKCVEAWMSSGFKYTPFGQGTNPGCNACPPLVCTSSAQSESDCINWVEGCLRREDSQKGKLVSDWSKQCKDSYDLNQMAYSGLMWGNVSGDYLPLVCGSPPCIPKTGEIDFKITNIGNACMVWEVKDKNGNRYKGQHYKSQCSGATKNFSIPTDGSFKIDIEGGESKTFSSQYIIDKCGYNSATGNGQIEKKCWGPKWSPICRPTEYKVRFK